MSGFSLKELYILEEQFEQYFYTDLNVNIHYVIAATLCPKVATGFPQIGFYKEEGTLYATFVFSGNTKKWDGIYSLSALLQQMHCQLEKEAERDDAIQLDEFDITDPENMVLQFEIRTYYQSPKAALQFAYNFIEKLKWDTSSALAEQARKAGANVF